VAVELRETVPNKTGGRRAFLDLFSILSLLCFVLSSVLSIFSLVAGAIVVLKSSELLPAYSIFLAFRRRHFYLLLLIF
jgi:hypothetical protein